MEVFSPFILDFFICHLSMIEFNNQVSYNSHSLNWKGQIILNNKKAILYLIIASILWSTGGLFIKIIEWNPMAIAGMRSGIAALVMLLYLRHIPPIRSIKPITILGALSYSFLVICFVTANKLTTSANAILLQYTSPIWVMLFSWIILKNKIKWKDIATMFVVFFGMFLFFAEELNPSNMLGNVVAIISGVFMAAFVILLKQQKDIPLIYVTLLGNIFTFLFAIPFYFTSTPNSKTIGGLLFLGVFQLGISYLFYTKAVAHVTLLEATLIPILEPLLNPFWVFFVTGEKPGTLSILGGCLVVAAVLLYQLFSTPKEASTPS